MIPKERLVDGIRHHYGPLVGATIEAVEAAQDCEGVVYAQMRVRLPDGAIAYLIPLRDREGNGPGHLDIVHGR